MTKKTKRSIIGVLYDLTILGGLFASHYYESPFWIRVAIFFCWASALTALLVTIVIPFFEDKDFLELEIPQWRAYQTSIADIAVIVLLVGWGYTIAAAVSFIGHGVNTMAYHMKLQSSESEAKNCGIGSRRCSNAVARRMPKLPPQQRTVLRLQSDSNGEQKCQHK